MAQPGCGSTPVEADWCHPGGNYNPPQKPVLARERLMAVENSDDPQT